MTTKLFKTIIDFFVSLLGLIKTTEVHDVCHAICLSVYFVEMSNEKKKKRCLLL